MNKIFEFICKFLKNNYNKSIKNIKKYTGYKDNNEYSSAVLRGKVEYEKYHKKYSGDNVSESLLKTTEVLKRYARIGAEIRKTKK